MRRIHAWLRYLEIKLHTNAFEIRQILGNDTFDERPCVWIARCAYIYHAFKNKDLVCLLLVHDEVLSANDGNEVLTMRHLHTDNFIWLSMLRFHQRYLYFALRYLHICVHIVEVNAVNFADEEGVHALDGQSTTAV